MNMNHCPAMQQIWVLRSVPSSTLYKVQQNHHIQLLFADSGNQGCNLSLCDSDSQHPKEYRNISVLIMLL